jgi:hypothetical protein
MRRARHKLEVSTFPFLAVLLCAMGALIFFLLVMDQRGKMVAQHKAAEARAARLADRSKEDETRRAEWEKQRDALHAALLAQQQGLQGDTDAVRTEVLAAEKTLQVKRAEHQTLMSAASLEGAKLASHQTQVKQTQASMLEFDKLDAAAKKDLIRLSAEIGDLEKVLADLKALKKRDNHTYSLVPYHGKLGDTRRPLYVECMRDGLVFHPDRRTLTGLAFNAVDLRGEVERRAGGLEREEKNKGGELPEAAPPRGPYVLFLIRPDGIPSYYQAMSFLKGFQIDFGYEVVDQHWVLEFAADDKLAGGLPWRKTPDGASTVKSSSVKAQGSPKTGSLVPSGTLAVASGNGAPGGTSSPFGSGQPGSGLPGSGLPGSGLPGSGLPGSGLPGSGLPGSGLPGSGLPGSGLPGSGLPGSGLPGSGLPGSGLPGSGLPGSGLPGGGSPGGGLPGGYVGAPSVGGSGLNATGGNASVVPATPGVPRLIPVADVPPPVSLVKAGPGLPFGGVASGPGIPIGTTGNSGVPPSPRGGVAAGQGTSNGTTGKGAGAAGAAPDTTPSLLRKGSTTGAGGGDGSMFQGRGYSEPPQVNSVSIAKPGPATPQTGVVLGNRDFIMTITCFSDHVTVYPGGKQHWWKGDNAAYTDQAVVKNVQDLIAGRQRSVQPGEPPYRPVIRFRLAPDGLAAYLHVYPMLTFLQVPMTRENLDD